MGRDSIHQRIDELLGLLSIHNNRLSLHTEKLSQLDIDVLRKQCIDLYDEVNRLALQGKIKQKTQSRSTPRPINAEPVVPEVEVKQAEKPAAKPIAKEEPKVSSQKLKSKGKKKVDDEMLSLFEKFSSEPIASIPKAISVAKRFEFQSAFFDGDHKEYNVFMESLDAAADREAAFEIYHDYKTRQNWDQEELKDELKALMYRKHT